MHQSDREISRSRSGLLTIVGIGLKFVGHVTTEIHGHIEHADKVCLVLADAATIAWVRELNPMADPLPFYTEKKPQHDTYQEYIDQLDAWVEKILTLVREGLKVCVVLSGHPGVGVFPTHEVIRRARLDGLRAQMLPGISAEDCLFADLGVDPIQHGCQSFEATDFLLRRRQFSISSALILLQIGMIGEFAQIRSRVSLRGLRLLTEVLEISYGRDHEVVVYEAALTAITKPTTQRIPLVKVPEARITECSTLYIPPKITASIDPVMLERLSIPPSRLRT